MQIEYFLTISVFLNLILTLVLVYRPLKKKQDPTKETLKILADLHSGGVLLEIHRVDPMSVFLVSPNERE